MNNVIDYVQPVARDIYSSQHNNMLGSSSIPTGSFVHLVQNGLDAVNDQLTSSQIDLQKISTGDVKNLHQVMIRLEEAKMSFQLLMQVRNRALEAYQEIMKMQI